MQIERLKLYHYPASRSARVTWALHEVVGNDFEVEKVALYDAALFAPDFLSINPNHNVPVLQINWPDGAEHHTLESAAIVAILASKRPGFMAAFAGAREFTAEASAEKSLVGKFTG